MALFDDLAWPIPPVDDVWGKGGLQEGWGLGDRCNLWSELPSGLLVLLIGRRLRALTARIDTTSEDGSVVWIKDETWNRRLIHQSDGYQIYALARIPVGPRIPVITF